MFSVASSYFIFLPAWAAIRSYSSRSYSSPYLKATRATSQQTPIIHSHIICFFDHPLKGAQVTLYYFINKETLAQKGLDESQAAINDKSQTLCQLQKIPLIYVKNHWSWGISVASKATSREGTYQWKNVKYESLVAMGHQGSAAFLWQPGHSTP